jgi:hypothetical protein
MKVTNSYLLNAYIGQCLLKIDPVPHLISADLNFFYTSEFKS